MYKGLSEVLVQAPLYGLNDQVMVGDGPGKIDMKRFMVS